jgi:four helix bundle protein
MSFLKEKSYAYSLSSIGIYKDLINKNEYVLSKQFMRSSTSIGANIREAVNAQSKKDFIHKLSISQKECDESLYWLELMKDSEFITIEQFNISHKNGTELLKMLKSSIITAKRNLEKGI